MNILKSLPVWLSFIPIAILNGGLREYVLAKTIGAEWALPVSGITLSVCIFLITWLLLPFSDYLATASANNKSLYLQRWLVDWDRLGIVDDCI